MDYGKNTRKLDLAVEAIAKAKELLVELGENNGLEVKDESEEVKVKRPKAKSEEATMSKDANEAFAGDTNTVVKASNHMDELKNEFAGLIQEAFNKIEYSNNFIGYHKGDIKGLLERIQELLDRD